MTPPVFKRLGALRLQAAICLVALPTSALAVTPGVAPLGFSGALTTPMAQALDTGDAVVAFSHYLNGQNIDNKGYNYVAGVGLPGGVELFGRLATNTIADNCFTEDCGIRDLSASAKWQLPSLAALLPEALAPWTPDLAIGITDVGGASTFFRTYYGVATWDAPYWAVSLGLAKASSEGRDAQARLSGPFGSLVLQPWPWLQGIVEHDGTDPQAGLRVLTLPDALPGRLQLQAELMTGAPRDLDSQRSLWWGASLKVPLGGDARKPAYVQSWVPGTGAAAAATEASETAVAATRPVAVPDPDVSASPETQAVAAVPSASEVVTSATVLPVEALAQRLADAGFNDVRIGRAGDAGWLIRVENQAYPWSDLDALGVVLGEFAGWSVAQPAAVSVQLTRHGQVVTTVASDTRCAIDWLQRGQACDEGVLRYPSPRTGLGGLGLPLRPEGGWLVNGLRPSRWRPRVELAPVLRYAVGTEFGAMDYAAGLGTTVELPLGMPGLLLEARHITPVTNSSDYDPGNRFADDRLQSGVDRVMLHQYLSLSRGLSAHVAAGQVFTDYRGALAEGRWESPRGLHKVSALAGDFRDSGSDIRARPAVVGYRFQFPYRDVQLAVKAGEFFDADRGYQVGMRFGFSDTLVGVVYRDTQRDDDIRSFKSISVDLSLPLTPRRVLPGRFGQLRGSNDFSLALGTRVGNDSNDLASAGQRGRFADAPYGLDQELYNRDRLSPAYIDQHLPRLRAAYERYVAQAWRYEQRHEPLVPATGIWPWPFRATSATD